MAYDGRVYQILIASPSDVVEERDIAVRVIQDWNRLHSSSRGVAILPLRWETHTAPEYPVRPQEAINRRIVDECDLLVGIFWTKLGSPTGEAESGTIEEIQRVAKAGKPVMLYFSDVKVEPSEIELQQLKKVRNFHESVIAEKLGLVETFRSPNEFRDKFSPQLEMRIRDLQAADNKVKPPPLELQFLSLETGKPIGNSLSTNVYSLSVLDDGKPDGELGQWYEQALEQARLDAALAPVPLTIKNVGTFGIRNLFVEMSIRPVQGTFGVVRSAPMTSSFSSFVLHDPPKDDVDRRLARLRGEGLIKDGDEWKYSFEWDAIQPQRDRRIDPTFYLYVSNPCKAMFSAKVYADNFAVPIVISADTSVGVELSEIKTDAILERAKQLAEENRTRWTASTAANVVGPINISRIYTSGEA